MIYRIKDWAALYENNRSREVKTTAWVPIPNRLDSDGYTLMLERQNGAALWGAWVAMVLVASRCDPRGTLLRDGSIPHDSASLSRMTRIPKAVIEEMLDVCVNESKWLETIESHNSAATSQAGAVLSQDTAQKEGKKEGKKEAHSDAAIPTLEEIKTYASMHGVTPDVAQRFYDYHQSQNVWLNQFNRPIDWKTKIVRWQNEERQKPKHANHHSNAGGQRRTDLNAGTVNDGKASQYRGMGKVV